MRFTPPSTVAHDLLDLRLPSKRKLDDYSPYSDDCDGDEDSSNLVFRRMHKQEQNAAVFSSSDGTHNYLDTVGNYAFRSSSSKFSPAASSSSSGQSHTPYNLQFFVRPILEGSTLCIQASPDDTIQSIHTQIHLKTGIPAVCQRLIYLGKQLQLEHSVAESLIKKDCVLNLVGRLRSTEHPLAWQVLDDMVTNILRMCRGEPVPSGAKDIKDGMTEYFSLAPKDHGAAAAYFQIFLATAAPEALVILRVSAVRGNKECAGSSIKHFLSSLKTSRTKSMYIHCAPIVLEFCKLLRKITPQDPLYLSCRSTLGWLLESLGSSMLPRCNDGVKVVLIQDIFPFVVELADSLSKELESSIESTSYTGPLFNDVHVFADFVLPLRKALADQIGLAGLPVSLPLRKRGFEPVGVRKEIECLHGIFKRLLSKVRDCLMNMDPGLTFGGIRDGEFIPPGWSQYLVILKELHEISKLYQGAEQEFANVLRCNKSLFCALITQFAKRIDDHQWILEYKDVTNSEAGL